MKRWFLENFLPFWAKETVLQDNRALRRQVRQLRQENEVLLSYIRGLEKGMRTRSVGLGRGMTTPQSGIRDSRQLPLKGEPWAYGSRGRLGAEKN